MLALRLQSQCKVGHPLYCCIGLSQYEGCGPRSSYPWFHLQKQRQGSCSRQQEPLLDTVQSPPATRVLGHDREPPVQIVAKPHVALRLADQRLAQFAIRGTWLGAQTVEQCR